MSRFKLHIEYEGTRYFGWQVQKNSRTVQGGIIGAFKKVFKTDYFELQSAGKIDVGVHAWYRPEQTISRFNQLNEAKGGMRKRIHKYKDSIFAI